jgi:hypothetical protein
MASLNAYEAAHGNAVCVITNPAAGAVRKGGQAQGLKELK